MKKKSRIPAARMALFVNKLTTAIVPTGAHAGDPLDPFVQTRKTGNDRTEIAVGTRTFFAGSLDAGGPAPVQVVAERRPRGNGKGEQETFHPVKADLTLDTAVELYKQPQGRWGVLGGRPVPASAAWLAGDGFDALNAAPFQPGFRQIGSRECCIGEVMMRGKASEKSAPVLVERVLGPNAAGDRFRLVNADLGRGDPVELVDGPARSDPFATEVLRRIGMTWGAGPGRQVAEATALNALKAGASVEAAVALANGLLPTARRDFGPAAVPTYAAIGAAAGAARRAGLSAEAAADAAQNAVVMAEYLEDRPAAIISAYAGAPAGGVPDLRTHGLLTGADVPTAAESRSAATVAAHAAACAGLAAVQAQVAVQDRHSFGPDLSAINAAARELLIEKKIPTEGLAAVAARAAEKRIELIRKHVREVSADVEKTGSELRQVEVRIEAELAKGTPDGAATQATLQYERRKRDELAATLRRQGQEVQAAERELGAVSGDAGPRLAAAVKALEDAHKAAPGKQYAAVAAAKAAAMAMRSGDDPVRAERAAAAAHLAALAGADEDGAEVAGRLMAGHHDAAGGALNDMDAKAVQAAIVQVVIDGIPANADARRRQLLAAAAATATLQSARPSPAAAATTGPAVAAADATPAAGNRVPPVFAMAAPDAGPAGTAAPALPAIPKHYEPIETRFDPATAVPVDEWKHAKIRQVTDLGLVGDAGPSTTTYIIEVMGPKGRYWADFDWSPNANQLYGEIPIKPSGAADDRLAAQAKTVIAYSGITSDWGSFEQRTSDLKARTEAAFAEVARVLTSRDHDGSMTQLRYHGQQSGHLANLLPHVKTRMEEEIRLFVQGRHSQPAFKENLAKMFVDLIEKIEADRSRKKAIIRHQVDTLIRVVLTIVIGGGVGGARVAAGFMGG
jgi:peptidoglycan hydrolase-like protein with peptidoglycan-binding domain